MAIKNASPGDKVQIYTRQKIEKGILLESHEPGVLLLKLSNGYNIGIKKEDISRIEIIEHKKHQIEKKPLKNKPDKPLVDFYLTGGTIASKLDPRTGAVKWLIKGEEFFSIYPEILDICNVRVFTPFFKSSENMQAEDWIKLAKKLKKSLTDPQVKGIVICHGTDFLHYCAAAMSFMIRNLNKPLVFTYSQRSSDRGSSDGRLNLICATHIALSDIAEVSVVGHANLNDEYCHVLQGNKCRKMHTSRRDTFRPINTSPLAKVWPNGKIEILRTYSKRNKEKPQIDAVFNDKVALIKFYPGQNPKILDYYLKEGYKGVIIEASGLGHVISEGKNNWIPKIKEVIQKGMLVYFAPQTLYGRLDPYVYSPARELEKTGAVFLKDILPETAFVKLGWVLAHKEWTGLIATRLKMLENIANEFNDRATEFLN